MDRLSEYAKEGEMVNIVDLLNFLTFDIIGDLTFGESFGGLQRNDYHPWVRFILEGVRNVGAIRLAVFYPIILPFLPFVFGKEFMDSAVASDKLSESKAAARIERGEKEGRRDFMTYMTKKDENGAPGITYREQIVNSPLLIGAGSETTATALSGLFFYMGQEPKLLKKLTEEVRGAFKSESEIDLRSTAKLVYLHACIEETLRIYPPAAETSPRVSPGIEIENTFVPKGVSIPTPIGYHNMFILDTYGYSRPCCPFINGPPFEILRISLTLTLSVRKDGFLKLMSFMIRCFLKTIGQSLSRLVMGPGIVLEKLSHTPRCGQSSAECSTALMLSLAKARGIGMKSNYHTLYG